MPIHRLLLAFLLTIVAAFATSPDTRPRNVVIFISDDHGLDTGAYGNPVVRTPHLDALARDATRYTHAFSTTASCSPSRAVVLSGLQVHANGQYGLMHFEHNSRAFDGIQTLPNLLTAHGYETVRVGKYHVAPEHVFQFDRDLGTGQGGSRNPVAMAERCREVIADDSRPFFLYFATSDPHRGPRDATDLPGQPNLFGNERDYDGVREQHYDPAEVIVPPYLPDTLETRAEIAQYYQSVSRIDQGVGRLIEILREHDQYDNTLFIYMSDNGIAMPGAKTNLYDAGVRLPLIVRSPDATRRGLVSDAMVSWVDITPTVLDFVGLREVVAPHVKPGLTAENTVRQLGPDTVYTFQGRSFLPTLERESNPAWRQVFGSHIYHESHMYYPMRMVRTDRYKLILNIAHPLEFPVATDLHQSPVWQRALRGPTDASYGLRTVAALKHRPKYELYDMIADPHEATNLADDPRHVNVLRELQAQLRAHQAATNDPWIVKYDHE